MKKIYYNSGYFFLILFAFVLLGFYKTYFGLIPRFNEKTTLLVHFHAAVLTTWVLLLIAQPLLVKYKKLKIHRLLGKFTYFLVPLIVCSMAGMVLRGISLIPGKATPFLIFDYIYFPLIDCILFITFYTLAIIHKKKIQLHSGYMIGTGFIFFNPSLTRLIYHWFHLPFLTAEIITIVFTDAIIVALILYLKHKKLDYRPYGLILSLFLIYHITTVCLTLFVPGF